MLIARRITISSEAQRAELECDAPLGAEVIVVTGGARPKAYWGALPADVEALVHPRLPQLELAGRRLVCGGAPWLMGIVNVTPDSFSDGGRHHSVDAAVAHALGLIEDGADLLDVGGESTRPGAAPVSLEEELARVVPVIARLAREAPSVPLSVDTSKPEVAEAALDAGASFVNDVSAFATEGMAELVAASGAAACLMHMQGTPRTMQAAPRYDDVVHDVALALEHAVARAVRVGVKKERLCVDPGIGFGKSVEHNLTLLKHLSAFRALGVPVLLGVSRKSFLGTLTGQPVAEQRDQSSAVVAALMTAVGAVDVLRVHDVTATKEAVAVALALRAGTLRAGDV